jgi:thiol-disulfide isomerase/thioredoxin
MMDAVMPVVKSLVRPVGILSKLLPRAAVLLALLPAAGPGMSASGSEEILLGKTRSSAILDISPEWQRRYEEYAPAPEDLEVVRQAPDGSLVTVYFGSWCSDSRLGVPHFLKILDEAQAPHLKVLYVGVDRTKKEPARRLEGVGLELVPTFVVSIHGHEVGRIVETPATTLEHDLAQLFRKAARSPAP